MDRPGATPSPLEPDTTPASPVALRRAPGGAHARLATWACDPGGEWHWVHFTLTPQSLRIDAGTELGRFVIDLVDIRRLDEVDDTACRSIELETVRGEVIHTTWDEAFTQAVVTALRATLSETTDGTSSPDDTAPHHGGAPRRRCDTTPPRSRRFSRGTERALTAAAIAALCIGVLLIDLGVLFIRIDTAEVGFPEVDDGVTTWVLVGTDSRAAMSSIPDTGAFGSSEDVPGERADVVLLVQEGTAERPPTIVSVPRDLLVFRRDKGVDRLALTYLDGPTSFITSICRSLGVAVDHLVAIDFDGIRRLVDHVEGIRVDSPLPTRDLNTGLELDPGTNLLDGAAAVAWVRSRKAEHLIDGAWVPDHSADGGRQENQRELLMQLSARLERQARHPFRARSTAWTTTGVLRTGSNTLPPDLLRLALTLRESPHTGSLEHVTLPGHIPVARLTPPAERTLDQLRNGRPDGPPCPRARLN